MTIHKGEGTTVHSMRQLFCLESKNCEAQIRAAFASQYDDYQQLFEELEGQQKDKEWATNEQIFLATLIFEQPVYVYSYSLAKACLFFGDDMPWASQPPIMLSFERGNHYNLLVKKVQ